MEEHGQGRVTVWVEWADNRSSHTIAAALSGMSGANLAYIQTDTGATTAVASAGPRIVSVTVDGPTAAALNKATQHVHDLCRSTGCTSRRHTPTPAPAPAHQPHHAHPWQGDPMQWAGQWPQPQPQPQLQAQYLHPHPHPYPHAYMGQAPGGWGHGHGPPMQPPAHLAAAHGHPSLQHPPTPSHHAATAAPAAARRAGSSSNVTAPTRPGPLGAMYIPTEFRAQGFIGPKTPWVIPKMEYSAEAAAALAAHSTLPPKHTPTVRFERAKAPVEVGPELSTTAEEDAAVAEREGGPALTDVIAAEGAIRQLQRKRDEDEVKVAAQCCAEAKQSRTVDAAATARVRDMGAQREAELEATLLEYHTQLTEVQNLLEIADESTAGGTVELVEGLLELIALTEAELAEHQSQRQSHAAPHASPFASIGAGAVPPPPRPSDPVQLDTDVVVSLRCSVPFMPEWGGGWTYNNAIVTAVDTETAHCTVLFSTPRHKAMVACKSFLRGACTRDDCQYSHGYEVECGRLRQYQDPKFVDLQVGRECLAKDREVWRPALLRKAVEGDGENATDRYLVRFIETDIERVLPIGDLLPLPSEHSGQVDESVSDSEDSDTDALSTLPAPAQSSARDDDFVPYALASDESLRLADWEQHTRGFGSKLLARMGYKAGRGLGKRSDGRIDPVPVTILPPGKSLDYCMDLKANGKLRTGQASQKRGPNGRGGGGGGGGGGAATPSNPEKLTTQKKRKIDPRLALNAESLKIDSKIQKIRVGLKERKERLARNPGMSADLTPEIVALQRALADAERKAGKVSGTQRRDAQRKKLVAF
jgi:hypothetical protein